ncbi:hypothetical protein ACF07Q_03225 [Nocardiopsis dassonvillei]|uniref:hypothetical protein n=1 Tax=Nocardiopsis dassonvillei TaxID=2014 RepID=UPI0036FA9EB2
MLHDQERPFEVLRRSVELITRGPDQPTLSASVPDEIDARQVSATQAIELLRHAPQEVTDALWHRLFARSLAGEATWTVIAAGALRRLRLGRCPRLRHHRGLAVRGDTLPNVLHNMLNTEPGLGAFPDALRPLVAAAPAKGPAARPGPVDLLLRLLGRAAEDDAALAPRRRLFGGGDGGYRTNTTFDEAALAVDGETVAVDFSEEDEASESRSTATLFPAD